MERPDSVPELYREENREQERRVCAASMLWRNCERARIVLLRADCLDGAMAPTAPELYAGKIELVASSSKT